MTAGIVVLGVKEVDDMLAELEPKLQNQALKPAIREAAKDIVLPLVKSRVPVKTGTLRRLLTVRTAKGKADKRLPRGTFGSAVTFRTANKSGNLFSGETFYGGIIEFGTKKHRTHPTHRIRPHRYLRSSLYDSELRIRRHVADAVRVFIPKVKAKQIQIRLFGSAGAIPRGERIKFKSGLLS